MKQFDKSLLTVDALLNNGRKPDFNNLLQVLRRERPMRPTLYEFGPHGCIGERLSHILKYDETDPLTPYIKQVDAYKTAGYDYVITHGSDLRFTTRHKEANKSSISLNEGAVISDRDSFNNYQWPNVDDFDFSRLEKISECLPEGMKTIVMGPDGVLETVIALVGYENLCYMIIDDPDLVQDIFNKVGSRFVRYYEISSSFHSVGALMSNDDWGFNTQTFLSENDMEQFVIPWHKKIAQTIHATGKPVILHSCGMLDLVMDDIIDNIKYNAKHSYEDNIRPVEKAYEKYGGRIAILGGIDIDFMCRSTPEEVYDRSKAMLEQTKDRGGYALGSGNSIPNYVPFENYLAMITAAVFY